MVFQTEQSHCFIKVRFQDERPLIHRKEGRILLILAQVGAQSGGNSVKLEQKTSSGCGHAHSLPPHKLASCAAIWTLQHKVQHVCTFNTCIDNEPHYFRD